MLPHESWIVIGYAFLGQFSIKFVVLRLHSGLNRASRGNNYFPAKWIKIKLALINKNIFKMKN